MRRKIQHIWRCPEENPKGPFIKYDLFKDEMEWVNVRKRATDVFYLPVITVDEIEGMEL